MPFGAAATLLWPRIIYNQYYIAQFPILPAIFVLSVSCAVLSSLSIAYSRKALKELKPWSRQIKVNVSFCIILLALMLWPIVLSTGIVIAYILRFFRT